MQTTATFEQLARLEERVERKVRRQWFFAHLVAFIGVQLVLFVVWQNTSQQHAWFWYPLLGWGSILLGHAYLALFARTRAELTTQLASVK